VILSSLRVEAQAFEKRTGWVLKPQGACKGDMCVPLPDVSSDGTIDVEVLSARLGMPLVANSAHGLWALGPDTVTGRALTSAAAPDIALPDLEGRSIRLADLRPQKVVLVAWASW